MVMLISKGKGNSSALRGTSDWRTGIPAGGSTAYLHFSDG